MTERAAGSRRPFARFAAGLLLAALAVGCGPGREGRRLAVAVESPPLTLDPRGAFNADTAHVQQLVFNTLVTKGPNYDFAPELAESWDASPDFTVYTFRLRPGVRFHDGRELTSRDVAHTFNSLVAGGYGKSAAFHALARVEEDGPLAVRFVCSRPNPGLLVDLVAVGVVPDGAGEEFGRAPIGTGPFRVAEYAGEGDLRLERFEGYFGGAPEADGIDVRVVRDASAREAGLEAGEIDVAINAGLGPEALGRLGRDGASTRVVSAPGGGVQFVALNTERPGLGDARVRRALALAVDRGAIVASLLGGRARLAAGPLPPGHWAAAPLQQIAFDPDAARRLLGEARGEGVADGVAGGGPLSFELMTLPASGDLAVAAVLQEMWKAVGVDVRLVTVEPAVFFERLTYGEYDAALHRFTGGNQFTTIFKGAFHSRSIHSRGGRTGELNYARLSDPELDALIDRADLTPERTARIGLYAEIQFRVAAATPWVALWHPDTVAVFGPRAAPFELTPGGDFFGLRSGRLAP